MGRRRSAKEGRRCIHGLMVVNEMGMCRLVFASVGLDGITFIKVRCGVRV